MGVWSRMAGKIAALAMCKEQNLTIVRPVPSNLRNPRVGSMRENNLFTTTGAGDSTNNQASTLVQIQDGTNWPTRMVNINIVHLFCVPGHIPSHANQKDTT